MQNSVPCSQKSGAAFSDLSTQTENDRSDGAQRMAFGCGWTSVGRAICNGSAHPKEWRNMKIKLNFFKLLDISCLEYFLSENFLLEKGCRKYVELKNMFLEIYHV